jgi:fibronectin type 3 domain-containing protein
MLYPLLRFLRAGFFAARGLVFFVGINCALAQLPARWTDQDIGNPFQPGSASWNGSLWTVSGGGADIWGSADHFNYAYESSGDNAVISAQVTSMDGTDGWAKAGVMFRDDTTPGSMFADVVATPAQGVSFQWRVSPAGSCAYTQVAGVVAPVWVMLARTGTVFSAFYSTAASTWNQIGTNQTISLASSGLAGLAVTAHSNALLNSATFSDVTLTNLPPFPVFLGVNYDAATPDSWTPPDPNAAAGPNYVVEASNTQMTIFRKNGALVRNIGLGTLLGNSSGGDPHVIYNENAQRFAIEELGPKGTLNFGVSTTADPNGSWTKQNIPTPGLWDGYGGNGIGYNDDAYVLRVNGTGNSFVVINAHDSMLAYKLVTSPYRLGQPVAMPGAAPGDPLYFVNGNDDGLNGQGGTAGWLEVVKVANVLSPTPMFSDFQVQVNNFHTSVVNVSWRNGLLAIAGKVIPSGGSVHQVTWYLLSTAGAAPILLQSGAIDTPDGGDAVDMSIAVAPNGNLGLNFLSVTSGGTSNTSIYVTGRAAADPPGSMQPPIVVHTGPNSNGRLGDFSSCVVDLDSSGNPQNSFVACNEYLNTTSEWDWRTRLMNFTALPSSPTGLSATGADAQVNLTWTACVGAIGYNVKRSLTNNGPYDLVGTTNAPNYADAALDNGTPYYYVVSAVTSMGEGIDSGQVSATPGGPPPAAPTGLAAVAGSNQVSLSWNPSATATGYEVKRTTTIGGPYYGTVGTVTDTNYTDVTAQNFVTYYYVVTAVNDSGERGQSSPVAAAPFAPPPQPAALKASSASATDVVASWLGVFGAAAYHVKRSASYGGPYTVVGSVVRTPALAMSFSDSGVIGPATYYYVVSAYNGAGESPDTAPVGVGVLAPPWVALDIGTSTSGSTSYGNNRFSVIGSGGDIWNNADAFRYVYQPVSGDGDVHARVLTVQNTDGWAKVGVMLRNTTAAGSMFAMVVVTPANGVNFQWRNGTNGCQGTQITGISAPVWVRVVRTGNAFSGSYSANGTTWNQIGSSQTIPMNTAALAGLAVTAHHEGALCLANFDNVAVSAAETVPLQPVGLSVTSSNAQLGLSWMASADATSYHVKRSVFSGGPYGTMASVAGTNYTDTSVVIGTTYYYVVSAFNSLGESLNSSEVSATVIPAPVLLTVGSTTAGQFSFSFQAVNGQNYIIQTSTNLVDWIPLLTNSTTTGVLNFTDTNATAPELFYRVTQ